jgi:hypothetical protein
VIAHLTVADPDEAKLATFCYLYPQCTERKVRCGFFPEGAGETNLPSKSLEVSRKCRIFILAEL